MRKNFVKTRMKEIVGMHAAKRGMKLPMPVVVFASGDFAYCVRAFIFVKKRARYLRLYLILPDVVKKMCRINSKMLDYSLVPGGVFMHDYKAGYVAGRPDGNFFAYCTLRGRPRRADTARMKRILAAVGYENRKRGFC